MFYESEKFIISSIKKVQLGIQNFKGIKLCRIKEVEKNKAIKYLVFNWFYDLLVFSLNHSGYLNLLSQNITTFLGKLFQRPTKRPTIISTSFTPKSPGLPLTKLNLAFHQPYQEYK